MIQLRLFHKMGWKIDVNHEKYKVYRLRLAADKVRKGNKQKLIQSNVIEFTHFISFFTIFLSKNFTTVMYGFSEA